MRKPHYVSKKTQVWAKHLRPYGKRLANKSYRKNSKLEISKSS